MKSEKWILLVMVVGAIGHAKSKNNPGRPSFHADALVPGKTAEKDLGQLVGNPLRVLHERGRALYFYDVGLIGASMTATVSARRGLVEYVTYLCEERLGELQRKYAGRAGESRVPVSGVDKGVRGGLRQITFEDAGRAFIFSPRSERARVCIKFEPGRKFGELGGS